MLLPAHAVDFDETAAFLVPHCARLGSDPSVFSGTCVGIVETYAEFANELPDHSRSCPPKNITRLEMVTTVVDYATKDRTFAKKGFILSVIWAFKGKWPCPRG